MLARTSARTLRVRVRVRVRPSAVHASRGAASLIPVRDTRDRRLAAADARLLSTAGSGVAAGRPLFGETWVRSIGWHTSDLIGDANKRWMQVPLASINHLCIGSVFSWSMFNGPLTQLHGVVAPAAADWVLGDITITFSLIMGGFAWGAIFGKYLDAWGARVSCLVGATGLGAGWGLAGLASSGALPPGLALPALYTGGLLWGLANGFAYVPPVSNLLQWFPSSKGFASGMCIAGYGTGAMITSAAAYRLINHFRVAPEYLGKLGDVPTQTIDGVLYAVGETSAAVAGAATGAAATTSALTEVVVATAGDAAKWADVGLEAGLYAVGTGSTGISETLLVIGSVYATTMYACAFGYRSPPASILKDAAATAGEAEGSAPAGVAAAPKAQLTTFNVAPEISLRSPQFWLLYGGFGCAITGAYGILSSGSMMMSECFSSLPGIVTPAFVAGYVSLLSAGNLSGRIGWTTLSDSIGRRMGGDPFYGRRRAYALMWGSAPLLYGGTLWSIHSCAAEPSALALGVFTASTMAIISSFGGSAAMRPALCGDLFGMKHVGVNSARQLSVVLPAAFAGPAMVAALRESSTRDALVDLAAKLDPSRFASEFGAPVEALDQLIAQKTVTIGRMMDLMPEGTIDPSPFVFDNTLVVCAGLQGAAFLMNSMLRPMPLETHDGGAAAAAVVSEKTL